MAGFPQSTVDRLVSKILPRGVRCDKKARSILNEAVTGVHMLACADCCTSLTTTWRRFQSLSNCSLQRRQGRV